MKHKHEITCSCHLTHDLVEIEKDDKGKLKKVIKKYIYDNSMLRFFLERTGARLRCVQSDCKCGSTQVTILAGHRELTVEQVKFILNLKK